MNADLVKANVSNAGTQIKPAAPVSTDVGVKSASDTVEAQQSSQQPPVKQVAATASEVNGAVEDISRHIQNVQRNLSFSIDEDSGSTVVKVIDTESDEVIRQYPTEEILEIRRHLSEMSGDELTGILVKTEA